jgi:hypothetical protein
VAAGPEESDLAGELSGGEEGIPPGKPGGMEDREDLMMVWAPADISPMTINNAVAKHRILTVTAGFG